MWFFVLNTCDKRIDTYFRNYNRNFKLEITIHIKNSQGSEFSSEESGFVSLEGTLLILNTAGFVYFILTLKRE